MKFEISTCVWGRWHLNALRDVALPTLLSPGNLPALAQQGTVHLRVFTTVADQATIAAFPLFDQLARLATVEISALSGETSPDPVHHVKWYHRAIDEARMRGAIVVFAPPDVVWADGTFSAMGRVMLTGRKGCAMPYLRVVSETCGPDVACRSRNGSHAITFSPRETVALGLKHLHPLSAAALIKSPHARPSLEMLWPVPGEGLLLRHIVRELFAFDPTRLTPTEIWYAGGNIDAQDVHVVSDSDEMMMLSLAPLAKDIGDSGIYITNHSVKPIDVARSSRHPLNDTPLNPYFGGHRIRLHMGEQSPRAWERAERRSDGAFRQAVVLHECMGVWRSLHEAGCRRAAQLLALGVQVTPFARRFRHQGPVTIFAPVDDAFDAKSLEALVRPGGAPALMAFLQAHVRGTATDREDTSIPVLRAIKAGRHTVNIIDRLGTPQCSGAQVER